MDFVFFLLAAFGAMIFWGIADFLIQKSVRKIGDLESLAFIGLIGAIGLFPFVLPQIHLLFSLENLLLLCLVGVINFAVAMVNFEALKTGKLSVVEVIMELELPVTIILAMIFLSEFISGIQFLLIVPIFVGMILMAIKSTRLKKHHFLEKGALLAFFAAIGTGLIDFLVGFSAREVSVLLAIWVPWLFIFVISIIFIILRKDVKKMLVNAAKFKLLILLMGITDTLAWVFYAFAMQNYNIAIVTAITEAYPVIGLALGTLINKEKIVRHQWLGGVITILAAIGLAVTLV